MSSHIVVLFFLSSSAWFYNMQLCFCDSFDGYDQSFNSFGPDLPESKNGLDK